LAALHRAAKVILKDFPRLDVASDLNLDLADHLLEKSRWPANQARRLIVTFQWFEDGSKPFSPSSH
jgi:hypothetical protein